MDPLTQHPPEPRTEPFQATSVGEFQSEDLILVVQMAISLSGVEVPVNGKRCSITDSAVMAVYHAALADIPTGPDPAIQAHLDRLAQWAEDAAHLPGVTVSPEEVRTLVQAAQELLD